MSERIRIGLVGCGRLAEHGYVPAIALSDRVRLVAVADPHDARASAVAGLAGLAGAAVRHHPDLSTMLEQGDVDAVVLASPAEAHVDDAAVAVSAGLPVLVEKPPAPDAEGAERLVALGGAVQLGFNRRFDTGARAVKDAVPADGPVTVEAALQYRRASWKPHTVRDDVLADLAPHLVDWVRWTAGQEVVGVQADEVSPDRARVRLATTRGTATITASADRFHAESLVVADGSGATIARHRAGGPIAAVTDRLLRRNRPHPLAASLAAQLDAFAGIVGGEPSDDLATVTDGLRAMEVVDAVRASVAGGGRQETISC